MGRKPKQQEAPKSYVRLLKLREVRAMVGDILGLGGPVPHQLWRDMIGRGLPLPEQPRGPDRRPLYQAYIPETQVAEYAKMIQTFVDSHEAETPQPRKSKRRWTMRFRRPGMWRAQEFRKELQRRLGWDIPPEQFHKLVKIGLIPEPEIEIPPTGRFRAWSDMQLEQSVGILLAHRIEDSDQAD